MDGAGNVYFADTGNNAIKKWTAATRTVTTLVASGLNQPLGLAVDGAGNVYFADSNNSAIKQWTAATGTVTTLVSSGLNHPNGVAVDGAGNIYIADESNNVIKKWTAATGTVATLVSSGLSLPIGVAVDGSGNVYIALTGSNTDDKGIYEWTAATGTLTKLISSGLVRPVGVAVDGAGNVYVSDLQLNALLELPRVFVDPSPRNETAAAGADVLPVLPATVNLSGPFAPNSDSSWLTLTGVTDGGAGYSFTANPSVSRTAYITLLGTNITVTQAGAFTAALGTNALAEPGTAGGDSVALTVSSPGGAWTATANDPWLHLSAANQSGAGSSTVAFTFDTNLGAPRVGTLTIAGQALTVTQYGFNTLGTTSLLESPAAGSDSVVLAHFSQAPLWTATANDPWLHLDAANQSGTGSTNVVFSFDANPGPTRSGTLTVDGQTLTVTQVGASYVPANPLTTLVSSGLNLPLGVAVDAAGNVYFSDSINDALKKWAATTGGVTTLVSSGLNNPSGVAVDGAGNVYLADMNNNAIKKRTAASGAVTTLISSGLDHPSGVAVDGAGNVYVADSGNNAIKEWTAASGTVTTLFSSGLGFPIGVAVDGAGNVYVADYNHNEIKKWTATSGTITTLVSSGLNAPTGVAVDGAGNVYFADSGNDAIKKWTAANGTVTTLASAGLSVANRVAVDGTGNVYIVDTGNNSIRELPQAWVDPTARTETAAAGADALPPVLPVTENLSGLFAPASDSPWLTLTGITNGVVSYSFTANPSVARLAHITLLGTNITVSQAGLFTAALGTNALAEPGTAGGDSVALTISSPGGPWTATANESWLHLSAANQSGAGSATVAFTFDTNLGPSRTGSLTIAGQTLSVTQPGFDALGTTSLLEGPASGSDSVVLAHFSPAPLWTATANDPWLHLDAANQNGTGSTNVVFTFDANPGPARTGTLTVAGQTLAVTQAGATYVLTKPPVTPVFSVNSPAAVALDGAGNVYIADSNNNAIKKWTAATGALTTLVSSGLKYPNGVAVDSAGNVYIADSNNNAIKKWTAASGTVTTLVSSGLNLPWGVALDSVGNVYFADHNNKAIKKWAVANGMVTTLVSSGLAAPYGVAVDGAGNVYIADYNNNVIVKWTAATGTVTTPLFAMNNPQAVAVDGSGNVYVADAIDGVIKKWTATTGTVTTLVSSGLKNSAGVAVDGAGNVYVADQGNNAIKELPRAFVDPTPKTETAAAGVDMLPPVLPTTGNLSGQFAVVVGSPWLTITGVTNGVVSYAFTANANAASRTAHITLLGQSIAITQAAPAAAPVLSAPVWLPGGVFQFGFTGTAGASYTVLFSTNVALPFSAWMVAGTVTNTTPGQFQFTTTPSSNYPAGFYHVATP